MLRVLPRVFTTANQVCKLSTSAALRHEVHKEWGTPLSEEEFQVPSFGGSVTIKSPIDTFVKPAGTLEYPNLDKAIVKLYSKTGHSSKLEHSDVEGRSTLETAQAGSNLQVLAKVGQNPGNDAISVEVPLVHAVNIEVGSGADVDVSGFMESDFCQVIAHSGKVTASTIKTSKLSVKSQTGDIHCTGQLQGDISLHSNSGNIIAEKRFLGPSLDVTTDTGDIRITGSYADTSKFTTTKGKMNLKNIHNESYVAVYESGDVSIKGVDGSTNIFVKKGDLDVHISQIKHESRIHVEEGNITLKMIDSHPIKITIDANQVIPDTKFSKHGTIEARKDSPNTVHYSAAIQPNVFSPTLTVVAENGNVVLESQDWAASLGIKLPHPKITTFSETV